MVILLRLTTSEWAGYTQPLDALGARDHRRAAVSRHRSRCRRALLRPTRFARLDLRFGRLRLARRVGPLELRGRPPPALRRARHLPRRALRAGRAARRSVPLPGARAGGARRGARGVRGRPARLARRGPDPERRARRHLERAVASAARGGGDVKTLYW